MAGRASLAYLALLLSALFGANAEAAAPPTPDPFSLPAELWEETEPKRVYLGAALSCVPEVVFENLSRVDRSWVERTSDYLNKAHQLNSRQTDGFVKAVMKQRTDLGGLPFLLGADCRMSRAQSLAFANACRSI